MHSDKRRTVFVGHDFTNRGGRVTKFRKIISLALKNSGFSPIYAGTSRLHQTLLKDITQKIAKCEFCIFDLTGYKKRKPDKNLNVILELGISIGLRKQPFIAYKEGSIDFTKELSDLLGEYRNHYKTYEQLKLDIKLFIRSLGEKS
ncbi:MAG TPA: TIR domain-containing protein [Thermodesulfobacteriota bacterium]|nr:TIR domain-containing protein [Thermodesulfobacteriota bacterium]